MHNPSKYRIWLRLQTTSLFIIVLFAAAAASPNGLGPGGPVNAIAVSGNDVYVGGEFTTAGGVSANHIAKWDGTNWSPLGSGMNGQVNALAVAGNGDLYAVGSFTIAGGVSANRVARWNGLSWSPVGTGFIGPSYSLAISGSTIYASGYTSFVAPGGIVRWNGSSWSAPGFGTGSWVNAIALSGSNVYAGGSFRHAGADDGLIFASRIARWSPFGGWFALGSGINSHAGEGEVRAIVVSGGNVYVGGNFTTAGGSPALNLAIWNGSSWSSFGSGANGFVNALSLSGNGDIYAGGGFTNLAGTSANRIAKWNGPTWSPIGSGMNGTVNALAIASDGTVYAGGNFGTAGGRPASNIAKWNGTEWSDLLSTTTPSQAAANITFANVQPYQMGVNWSNGNGHARVVKINTVNSFTAPSDGSDPSSDSRYGGSGEQVVYNGHGNSFTVTGLSPNTTYYFRVYEYRNYGPYTLFNTGTAANNPNSQTTLSCNAAITVLNTNDSGAGSLRQAIADIPICGTINFDPGVFAAPQTITLTSGTLIIDKEMTIQGPGANLLSVSGNNASSVFHIAGSVFDNPGVTAALNGMTIRNGLGGGITADGATLYVRNSIVTQNRASGISHAGGSVTVSNSTISDNAHYGIFSDAACYFSPYLSVSNSTISGNGGTGIAIIDGLAEVANSTIVGNRGGIVSADDCAAIGTELRNTIVAGNTLSPPGPYGLIGTDIFGSGISAASHNLVGDAAYSGGIVNGVNGNIVGVNPLLGPLQNNGGPTLTHALLPGSPAINAGDNCVLTANGCGNGNPALPTDQRGMPRNGTVDIGAFERQVNEISSTTPFDYDGDGKSDISVYRRSDGNWYLQQSTNGISVFRWGVGSDIPVAADYDGDGRTDPAVFRDGVWWILKSTGGYEVISWGLAGDKPVPADYDGDGKADPAVFRDGVWWILKSTGGHDSVPWGLASDKPVQADYDGDGKTDPAIFRDGVWWILKSVGGSEVVSWGLASDDPVPADYDGDAKADAAIFRDGVWWILKSTGGHETISWGLASDQLVPADYDGDGKTDPAIFRDGVWWILKSTGGSDAVQWGLTADRPIPLR